MYKLSRRVCWYWYNLYGHLHIRILYMDPSLIILVPARIMTKTGVRDIDSSEDLVHEEENGDRVHTDTSILIHDIKSEFAIAPVPV